MKKETQNKPTQTKSSGYVIRLENNKHNFGTYRVDNELFTTIKDMIEPYRSLSAQAKPIRCIETKEIFESARKAMDWLTKTGKTKNYKADMLIKKVCYKKRDVAYGYHWEFVNEK